MYQPQPQPSVNPAPAPAPLDRTIRSRLSRVGWGTLLYLLAAQVLGTILVLIPPVRNSAYLTMAVNEVVTYGIGPLALWLMIRPLPKGTGPGLSLSPKAFVRTALFCLGTTYLFNLLTTLLMLAIETLTGSSIGNLRSATQNLSEFLHTRDRGALRKSGLYYFIILCFIVGAILGNLAVGALAEKAIFIAPAILVIAFIMMFIDLERRPRSA